MASITDYVVKLQEITKTNLDILRALNDSFHTKQNHLSVNIGGEQLAIPSFISLENRINSIQENLMNLVNAPESGEAFFNFDGNSRSIEVRPYTHTPNSLRLKSVSEFSVDNNDIFKDFMTPIPHINLNVQDLPNDTVQVMMKKIIPINEELVALFKGKLEKKEGETITKYPSIQYPYKDLYKILVNYTEDVDYIDYETKLDLPIRKTMGSGLYVIETILDDIIDENLDNYITVKFRTDVQDPSYMNALKYRLFDETIERPLKVGDELVTYDGKAKVVITELRPNTNTIVVKVVNGEYLNLMSSSTNQVDKISNLCKMRFYSPIDFDKDKFVKVPLEEDKYIFVALAALNSRMNVQSSWGTGLMVNTDVLLNGDEYFSDYYKQNVRNVGDILHEISSVMVNTLTDHSKEEFDSITNFKPTINTENLQVVQINKHLNDSQAVKNIRSLYSQKKELQTQLDEVHESISSINESLSQVSFDDTTGVRSIYTSQLNDLNKRKNEINTSISKLLNEIAIAANNSEVPIENGKYHIRGFFDCSNIAYSDHIRGIRVQYRYKNKDLWQGSATTFGEKFVYSDWNNMHGFDRQRIPTYDSKYTFNNEGFNDNLNEPSFNQIDIPISQGETVDIRLKIVYDFGWPFVHTTSDWSPIVNIAFPEEYLKDVQILDIISENNNEIETNRFQSIINEGGVSSHIDDKIIDQDITYYHKPENIASGFYTAERRIIPLKDKLTSIDALITELYDEIHGTSSENLQVSIKIGDNQTILQPYQVNNISVAAYSQFETSSVDGIYTKDNNGVVSTVLNLCLTNTSSHTVKLFSIFPGNRDTEISGLNTPKDKTGYTKEMGKGVWFKHPMTGDKSESIQSGNQFLYFRINNVHDNTYFYGNESDNLLSLDGIGTELGTEDRAFGIRMYPSLSDRYGLCLDSNSVGEHLILAPGEEIVIPIVFEYKLSDSDAESGSEQTPESGEIEGDSRTMSIDIRTSLYNDPINFTFKVTAKYTETVLDKVLLANRKRYRTYWGEKGIRYNSIIK